jgi:hypothetical protein
VFTTGKALVTFTASYQWVNGNTLAGEEGLHPATYF